MIKRILGLGACVAVLLALTACTAAMSPEKISQIKPSMKLAQVEAILGRPDHIDQAETTGLRGEVYHYAGPGGDGQVVFLNDVVFKAEFIPGGRST